MPASPLVHSNRREGRVCVSSRVSISHVHSVRERRMWVLRDLSVSAARPRAIFLIRPFANRPRYCAIVAYYMYRALSACWLLCLIASHANLHQVCLPTCQFIYRFCNPRRSKEKSVSRYRNILLGHCNISKKSYVRYKEITGYPENIFTHRIIHLWRQR